MSARHRLGRFTLDAAFDAPTPGVCALFGPSGAGKSTVLSIVAGLLRPDRGRVELDGAVLADTGRWTPAERRRCGMVFQDARLFPHMSVRGNLNYGARRAPPGPGPSEDDVVQLLGIAPLLGRRPGRLSGGERQRVAIGRALLSRPRLLLMDEPLAALDVPRRAEILPYLQRLRDVSRVPILYVTHALDEVVRLADTLVLMEAGRVVAQGPLTDMLARTDLALLTGRRDAGVVLDCEVRAHDPVRGLTQLAFAGGLLAVPLRADPVAGRLRLRLRARDVTIALGPAPALSTHNQVPATVAEIVPITPHEILVGLRVGPTPLMARITRDSGLTLGLAAGMQVTALIKAASFDQD